MSLIARIDYANWVATYPDQNGGETDSADVYVTIIDTATGQPTNGNNAAVTYTIDDNGAILTKDITVPGQSVLIYSGVIHDSRYDALGTQVFNSYISFSVQSINPGNNTIPPASSTCDAAILTVVVNQPESFAGATDAQITVNASSSHQPVLYSIDNVNFQTSPVFSGLSAGLKTIYIKDANGCTASKTVTIGGNADLLVDDPTVDLENGNISRWNAAFNPVVFTYQRKDFEVLNIYNDSSTNYAAIQVNGNLSEIPHSDGKAPVKLQDGDLIYLNAGAYIGVYNLYVPGTNDDATNYDPANGKIIIKQTYQAADTNTGFVNINNLIPYYKAITQITYQDASTGQTNTIISTNRPDSTGLVKADISNFLQSLLSTRDTSDYTQINFQDTNLSASYQIQYAQSWDDGTDNGYTSNWVDIEYPYYVVYAAKQLGDAYGGNLAAYVPFSSTENGNTPLAKWITDFDEPAYSNGYPFDISFIYSEAIAGRDIYAKINQLDINRKPLSGTSQTTYLLNEDGSFLLNPDGSKLNINRQTQNQLSLAQHIGLNRLLIQGPFHKDAYFLTLTLKYDDAGINHAITQTQIIRIDDAVDDNSVYLRWIGLTGSWNYYRFVYNQEITLDVQNAVIVKNYVSDWANQNSIEEVISKDAGQKMKVMAEDLSVNDIKGLQSIKYSPKVEMLVNKNPVKWQTVIINTATFTEYETRYGQYAFSITFNLPAINIQTQ